MKILNYKFANEKWKVDEKGEVVLKNGNPQIERKEYNATFCLLTSGLKQFEILTGQSLLAAFSDSINEETEEVNIKNILNTLDMDLIGVLASVSYLDPKNPNNIEISSKNFMESDMYECAITDLNFLTKLITMAFDCISTGDHKQKNKQKNKKNNDKKGNENLKK